MKTLSILFSILLTQALWAGGGGGVACTLTQKKPLRVEEKAHGLQTFQVKATLNQIICRGEGGSVERYDLVVQFLPKAQFNGNLPPSTLPVSIGYVDAIGFVQALSLTANEGLIRLENIGRTGMLKNRHLSLNVNQSGGWVAANVLIHLNQ